MTLKGFDIALHPLVKEDIEMVRMWRNSDVVRPYALHQEIISQEQQNVWFESLQHKRDEYFVILVLNVPIGLIWFNDKEGVIETGFYLYETLYQNSLTPYKIVSLFHDYLFHQKQFSTITCKIMPDNKRAIRFNLSLGYQKIQTCEHYAVYELSSAQYEKYNTKIMALLSKAHS